VLRTFIFFFFFLHIIVSCTTLGHQEYEFRVTAAHPRALLAFSVGSDVEAQHQRSRGRAVFRCPSNTHLHPTALPDRGTSVGDCRGFDLQQGNVSSNVVRPHGHPVSGGEQLSVVCVSVHSYVVHHLFNPCPCLVWSVLFFFVISDSCGCPTTPNPVRSQNPAAIPGEVCFSSLLCRWIIGKATEKEGSDLRFLFDPSLCGLYKQP